ncbi:MAG: PorP/SprF family type IX secretion system membrane protein [Saprospiraceae bacterium]|nr:PorP/SprF family type IX secretion system membrane protein [Saprospiraceae bacterium]
MIKSHLKQYFITIYLVFFISILQSQDVNFSQFNVLNSYYNPGATGFFDGNFKVKLINRNQWINYSDKPLRTFALNGDIKFDLGKRNFEKDYIGLGVYFLTDKVSTLDWNRNEIGVNLAFHKLLDKYRKTYLAGGIGLAVVQRSLSYENIYFQDQFDGLNQYNGNTNEILPVNIQNNGDLKLGLLLSTQFNKKWSIQIGAGFHYIFKPEFSLYRNQEDPNYIGSKSNKAISRINVITNLTYKINQFEQIFPRLHFSAQFPHQLIQTGLTYRRSFYNFSQTAFHGGLSMRIAGSDNGYTYTDLGLLVGFELKKTVIGFHYDFGIRDASKFSHLNNSFEISISLTGDYNNQSFICPEF